MKESMKDEVGRMKWGAQRPSAARSAGIIHSPFCILHSAFSLVEIVIAVGIFSFVIVAVMGTMSVALSSTRDSEMKLSATHTSAMIVGTLKANPASGTNTSFPISAITNGYPGGSAKDIYVDRLGLKTDQAGAAFRIAWKLTKDATLTNLYFCNIELAWPPAAPTNAVSSYRVATAILLP